VPIAILKWVSYAVYKAGIVQMQVPVLHGRGAGAPSRSHIIRVRSDESVDERVRQEADKADGAGPAATTEPAAVPDVEPDDGARRTWWRVQSEGLAAV
jgi:hypothetical protein